MPADDDEGYHRYHEKNCPRREDRSSSCNCGLSDAVADFAIKTNRLACALADKRVAELEQKLYDASDAISDAHGQGQEAALADVMKIFGVTLSEHDIDFAFDFLASYKVMVSTKNAMLARLTQEITSTLKTTAEALLDLRNRVTKIEDAIRVSDGKTE